MHLISILLITIAQIGVFTHGLPTNDTLLPISLNSTNLTNPSGPITPPHSIIHQTTGTNQYVTLQFGKTFPNVHDALQLLEGARAETDRLYMIFGRDGRVTGNLYVRSQGNVYLRIEGIPGMILPYFSYGVLHDAVLGYWQVYVEDGIWWTSIADFTIERYRAPPLSIASGIFNVFPADASSYPRPLPTPEATS